MNPRGLLMGQKKLIKFDTVVEQIEKQHDLNFEDRTVELKDVKVVKAGTEKEPDINLDVPGIGILQTTNWSKKQLGSILGVQWNKWFKPEHISYSEIHEEMTRRFKRVGHINKIRARRFQPGDPGNKHADGYLRAVLSPTYSAIDDVRVFGRLAAKFSDRMSDLRFMRNHLGTDFFNDRGSHFTVIGDPINLGPIDRKHPNPQVRRIYDLAEAEGALPDCDWVYNGFHFRNSEVGYTALSIDSSTFRLVCLNGAIVAIKDGRLLYRMHRGIDDDGIDGLLDGAFRKMPGAWELNHRRLVSLQEDVIDDVAAEIERFLERQKAPKKFVEQVKQAWEAEPLPNRYGVMQAITRAAKAELDMDKRAAIEEIGGRYLAQAA
jgi:hypothetical protein